MSKDIYVKLRTQVNVGFPDQIRMQLMVDDEPYVEIFAESVELGLMSIVRQVVMEADPTPEMVAERRGDFSHLNDSHSIPAPLGELKCVCDGTLHPKHGIAEHPENRRKPGDKDYKVPG